MRDSSGGATRFEGRRLPIKTIGDPARTDAHQSAMALERRPQTPYSRAGVRRPRSTEGMGLERANGSHWFYSYLPQGIAGGATSALIPLFAYGLGGSLSDVGIIAAATSIASVPSFMLWGSLSDRVDRRRVLLLIGFAGSALYFLLKAASRTLPDF